MNTSLLGQSIIFTIHLLKPKKSFKNMEKIKYLKEQTELRELLLQFSSELFDIPSPH
jgi:hypothetical protein